jgi:hypothetical protein
MTGPQEEHVSPEAVSVKQHGALPDIWMVAAVNISKMVEYGA